MKSSIVKRSVIVGGHKTSVSLEDASLPALIVSDPGGSLSGSVALRRTFWLRRRLRLTFHLMLSENSPRKLTPEHDCVAARPTHHGGEREQQTPLQPTAALPIHTHG